MLPKLDKYGSHKILIQQLFLVNLCNLTFDWDELSFQQNSFHVII